MIGFKNILLFLLVFFLFSNSSVDSSVEQKNNSFNFKKYILNGSYCFWDHIPNDTQTPNRGFLFLSDSTVIKYDYTINNERVFYSFGDIAGLDTLNWFANDSILQIHRFYTYKVIKYQNDSLVLDLYRKNNFINQLLYVRSSNQENIPVRYFNSKTDKYMHTWQDVH
jgi:hypothetical protein